jgi:hypothetical protein
MNVRMVCASLVTLISVSGAGTSSAEAASFKKCLELLTGARTRDSAPTDEDSRTILYYRRFPHEWPSYQSMHSLPQQAAGPIRGEPSLIKKAIGSAFNTLVPAWPPLKTEIVLRPGVKLGIVIGYHHLEKPWGRIFKEMFLQQVSFDSKQIFFIEIENDKVPTGLLSTESDKEIENAIQTYELTHIFDIHEFFNKTDYYSEPNSMEALSRFYGSRNFGASQVSYGFTDAFIPVWIMEKFFFDNKIVPLLQYAVNRHIQLLLSALNEKSLIVSRH